MYVYLRIKFQVSSIILTSFRQGVWVILLPPSQNKPLKSPPRLKLKSIFHFLQYLTETIETKSVSERNYRNSGMVHFTEINQTPPP